MNITKLKSLRTGMVRSCVMCGKVTAFPSKQRNETLFSEFLQTRHLLHLCTHLCCSGTFLGGVYPFQNQGSDIAYPNQKNYNSNSLLNPQVTVVAAVMITAAKDEYEGQTVRRLLVPCQNKLRVSYTNINLTYIYNAGINTAN